MKVKATSTDFTAGLSIAIDASRNRSGGAKAHLLGVLNATDPRDHGIGFVHVWSYHQLLQALPDAPWLIKHSPPEVNKSLFHQLWWQYRKLSQEISDAGCDVLLSTDAGTVCRFKPSIIMSRDMLSFEGKEMQRYSFLSFARLRLYLLKHMQVHSLRNASGALFLTHYAADVIQHVSGKLECARVIPHGVGEHFRQHPAAHRSQMQLQKIQCLYVSNADLYKHQWHVVHAIAALRRRGHDIFLRLVGGGSGLAKSLLDDAIRDEDPSGEFIEVLDTIPHSVIPFHLEKADIFIFASSCENMPNTLVEAMAAGLPIACSDRGPMPEILQDGGTYFNPEDPSSVAYAVERLILDDSLRQTVAEKAMALSAQYTWVRCAIETWDYLSYVAETHSELLPKAADSAFQS